MACNCNRNRHGRGKRNRDTKCETRSETTVVTDRRECCNAPETIAEEFYDAAEENILMQRCCDSLDGCHEMDERSRCNFWPRFAHPRWLSCAQLHNRKISD